MKAWLERMYGLLLDLARAGQPLPSNTALRDQLGCRSPETPALWLELLEVEGRIEVVSDHGVRIARITGTDLATARAKPPRKSRARPQPQLAINPPPVTIIPPTRLQVLPPRSAAQPPVATQPVAAPSPGIEAVPLRVRKADAPSPRRQLDGIDQMPAPRPSAQIVALPAPMRRVLAISERPFTKCQWLEGNGPWTDADKCLAPSVPDKSYCPGHFLRALSPKVRPHFAAQLAARGFVAAADTVPEVDLQEDEPEDGDGDMQDDDAAIDDPQADYLTFPDPTTDEVPA